MAISVEEDVAHENIVCHLRSLCSFSVSLSSQVGHVLLCVGKTRLPPISYFSIYARLKLTLVQVYTECMFTLLVDTEEPFIVSYP